MFFKKNKHFLFSHVPLLGMIIVFLLSTSLLCQSRSCSSRWRHINPYYRLRTLLEGCGKAKPIDLQVESPPRLKGSLEPKEGQFPYYVRLACRVTNNVFCSGMLISNQHILTAGHCMSYTKDKEIKFAGGVAVPAYGGCRSDKYELWDTKENYVTGARYDIALIKLDIPVELSDLIQPVCLPQKPIPPGLQLFSSGKEWRHYEPSGEKPGVVPSVQVECSEKHTHESILCARPNRPDKMESACHGDSGSPLAGLVDGQWTVFGIASYGLFEDCNFHNSSVTYYVDVYNMLNELKKLFAKCG